MSASDVTPIRSAGPASDRPAHWFNPPGFPDVFVIYKGERPQGLEWIEYAGTPDELQASGAVTADMLVMNRRSGPRVRRVDQDGGGWRVVRSWRHTKNGMDCAPYLWFRITRGVRGRLDALPFGREAFSAHDAWCRWDEAEREADRRAQRCPPQLRLVIDNTRPEAS